MSLYSDDVAIQKWRALEQNASFKIDHFEMKDRNRNSFSVSILANSNETRDLLFNTKTQFIESTGKKISKTFYYFSIKIGDIGTDVVPGTLKISERKIFFDIYGYTSVPSGATKITLYYHPIPEALGEPLAAVEKYSMEYQVPEPLKGPPPTIVSIFPSAAMAGELVTIKGRDFGYDTRSINIYFVDSRFDKEYEAYDEAELAVIKPNFVSTLDQDGFQEIKFVVPNGMDSKIEGKNFLRNKIKLRVLVHYTLASQLSDSAIQLELLNGRWKFILFTFSFAGIFLLLLCIPIFTKKWRFISDLLMDRQTNTYSLSRFQAFVWTITFFGSYLYIALCYAIIKDEIPEFNMSLLGLMTISYGSLLSANQMSKKNPKNELKHKDPSLGDLFTNNGAVDITRFQMFGFTILTVGLYIFNIYNSDILLGMPDIPATLHGLLLSSQAGYLGGKAVGDKIIVNQILPNKVDLANFSKPVIMIGNGFTDGMKIMLEGQSPIPVKFVDPTIVEFSLPDFKGSSGFKNLLLIPVSGATVEIPDAIEFTGSLPSSGTPEENPPKMSSKKKVS